MVLCARQRLPLPVLVYMVAMVVMALTTSGYFGQTALPVARFFPLLFPVASWLVARPRWSLRLGWLLRRSALPPTQQLAA